MGLFGSTKRISARELERALNGIDCLEPHERAYVQGLFSKYDTNGISKRDIRLAVREMKREMDSISSAEARAIKRTLLRALD